MRHYRPNKRLYSRLLAICIVAVLLAAPIPAKAAGPIVLNNTTSSVEIDQATLDDSKDGSVYSIQINATGTYSITITQDLELLYPIIIFFTGGQYDTVNLTINGNGHTIRGVAPSGTRLMQIGNVSDDLTVNTTIQGLAFEDGCVSQENGGALLYNTAGSLRLDSCSFRNNEANVTTPDPLVGNGGAVYFTGNDKLYISNCLFEDNVAGNQGGAICTKMTTSITGTRFIGNSAGKGGAIFLEAGQDASASTDIDALGDTEFYNNVAAGDTGGAIHIGGSSNPTITLSSACYFFGNVPTGNRPSNDAVYGIYSSSTDLSTGQLRSDYPLSEVLILGKRPISAVMGETEPLKLPAEFTVRALSWLGYVPMYTAPDTGSAVAFRLGYYYTVTVIEYVDGFLLCEYTAPNGRVYKGYVEPRYLGRTSGLTW